MKVEKGWQGFSEINRVFYDDREVDIKALERWIKESGTHVETLSDIVDTYE